ncbi:MAG: hypothetical protein PHU17_02380 [Candidatus Pacebacteria bacterium]|nr:hypothetical protein [Candidatus Paceibacterota bacterium]MDD4074344.1 hypothetical protein [Candidatus Paceibacterota bacterium]
MKNKLIAILLFALSFFVFTENTLANNEATIDFFEDKLCSTCKAQKEFMETIKTDYPQLIINVFNISDTEKLKEIANSHGIYDYKIMAPTSFINGHIFQFNDFTETQKATIINAIEGKYTEEEKNTINFLNKEIDLNEVPLLLTTIILSSVDGFNVCSIGALILILSIVLVSNSRRKTFIYGGIFILTAAIVYGVIVFAWGKIFELLLGQLEILRIVVGLFSLIGGIYFLNQFLKFLKKGPACDSSNSKIIKNAVDKFQESFTKDKGFLFLSGSIITFAAIITIVELPCSIGIPLVFVGILAESNLSLLAYLFYILVYLFFFMLIEIIIFTVAVFSKKIWLNDSKTVTWATFIGAVFLFYLAFYYLLG